jgi:hypothetical protein
METQTETIAYIFEFISIDGAVTIPFHGDINMSSFIENYIKDMVIEDRQIDLTGFGDRGMTSNDIINFINVWSYMSTNGSEFTEQISPEYFENKGNMPGEFLPAALYDILTPCDQEVALHKEWLLVKTIVPESELDTNIVTVQLSKFMPFTTLVKFINYANFLGIEPMIHLFAKLICEYSKLFISIKRVPYALGL